MVRSVTADDLRFLLQARWFAGKSRPVKSIELLASAPLAEDAVATIVAVHYTDSGCEHYFVPLVFTSQGVADGIADDHVARRLLEIIEREERIPCFSRSGETSAGELRAERSPLFASLRGSPADCEPVRPAAHDQSNSAVAFGERLFLKVFRKVEPGVNPDYEIASQLTQQGEFTRMPRVAGALEFQPPSGPTLTLAILQEWVPNDGSAWAAMLGDVQRALETPESPSTQKMELLGRRTAELHRALASLPDEPAFRAEPLTVSDCHALAARLRRGAEMVFGSLRVASEQLEPAIAQQVATLLERGPAMVDHFGDLLQVDPRCTKTRIHGDYHLGQVLCQGDDFVILDFEGEPARPLAERRIKDSPLRDVAGMLRSFGYAAHAALFQHVERHPHDFTRCEPIAAAWQQAASEAYLRGYFEVAKKASFLPAEDQQLATLLDFFVVEKALYEVQYELNNRPAWLRIPLAGILAIASDWQQRC